MSNNRTGSVITGMLIGAAMGTVAGLLFAPRSGRETRKLLKKSADALPEIAEDLSTSVQIQADRLSEGALRNLEGTLNRLREALAAGVEAFEWERQTLIQKETALQRSSTESPSLSETQPRSHS